MNCLSSYGVQMQPKINGWLSGACAGYSDATGHCSAKASPTGVGCVAEVLLNAFCGTGFSSICTSGFPSRALITYIQPVLQVSTIAVCCTPPKTLFNIIVGEGQS